ncbi:hypothetical protein O9993_19160 [Vibrio lentus]|nr:hypothetical protein [Vibrio lentus]
MQGIYELPPQIKASLPDGIKANVIYDSTPFIETSIDEV